MADWREDYAHIRDFMREANYPPGFDSKRYAEGRIGRTATEHLQRGGNVTLHRYRANKKDLQRQLSDWTVHSCERERKDFVGAPYLLSKPKTDDPAQLHITNLLGESWLQEALHILALFETEDGQIDVKERTSAIDDELQKDLLNTLQQYPTTSTLLLCPVARVFEALEYLARRTRILAEFSSRADPLDALRLERFRAEANDVLELYKRVSEDPRLGPQLSQSENVEVPPELLARWRRCPKGTFSHAVLTHLESPVLLVNIREAHGDVAERVVRFVLEQNIPLKSIQQFGSCGAIHPDLSLQDLSTPQGPTLYSVCLEPLGYTSNDEIDAQSSVHAHVHTLLQETTQTIQDLLTHEVRTIDIETYFLARIAHEKTLPLTAIHRVSDIPTQTDSGATRARRPDDPSRLLAERRAVLLLGLWDGEGESS